ncbi:hypothetical protein Bca4012_070866 [Brassica carinata]
MAGTSAEVPLPPDHEARPTPIEVQYHNLHREIKPARDVVLPRPAPVVEPLPAPTPSPSPPPPPSPPPAMLENRTLEIAESMTEPETVTTTALEKPEGDEEEAPTVVQIVKKGNPELSQQDDEIELDIDSLDIQTLWELYSFVTGYKESLSNKKEEDQGFGSERDAESAHNIIQEPGKLFACLLLLFGKKTRQVDQVVLTVPAVTQDLALVILTVTAPLDVDQILYGMGQTAKQSFAAKGNVLRQNNSA